jgi:hypothetical protein
MIYLDNEGGFRIKTSLEHALQKGAISFLVNVTLMVVETGGEGDHSVEQHWAHLSKSGPPEVCSSSPRPIPPCIVIVPCTPVTKGQLSLLG